jgi:hypothetical protein
MNWACRSVAKPGKARRLDVDRLQAIAVTADDDAVGRGLDAATGLFQLLQQAVDQVRPRIGQAHFPAGHGGGDGVGAHLDAIGDHRVGRAVQTGDTGDRHGRRARPLDLGAHGVQAFLQVDQLGLAGGVVQDGDAVGDHGGQHRMLGRADRDDREGDLGALQAARGLGVDIAFVQIDLGAQRFQRLQVQVDGARADGAAAGQTHLGLAGAGDQRAQHVERGPHLADQVIGREAAGDLGRVQTGSAGRRRRRSR